MIKIQKKSKNNQKLNIQKKLGRRPNLLLYIFWIFYLFLLTLFDRFLLFALFEQELLSVKMYFIDFITLLLISIISYRVAKINYMVNQYPWKYQKSGFFSYKNK